MNQYTIEITTTQACNFGCSYCFERDFIPTKTTLDKNIVFLLERLDELIHKEWIIKEFDKVQISFWGGEPTLNLDIIDKVVEFFKDNERIHFHVYTNGSTVDELIPIVLKVKDRFAIQVSYDGMPVQDLRRKTKDGKPTSKIVNEAFEKLNKEEINFSLKSTLTYEDYHYLPQIWDDFYRLRKKFGEKILYAITVDYHTIKFYEHKEEIEKTIIEIAQVEKEFYQKTKSFLTNLFQGANKLTCATERMLTIDTYGQVYFCHGCIYSSFKDDFNYTTIFENDFLEKVYENYLRFKDKKIPEECQNCVALMCLKCNVKKYENSSKKDVVERWTDYTSQKEICDYYKLLGRIGRALLNIIEEENNNGMYR